MLDKEKIEVDCDMQTIGDVACGRIPSGLIDGWNGIVFYFCTSDAYDAGKHEALVKPLIQNIAWQNDETEHGVSWRVTKTEAVVWEPHKQITLVSFRIRDSY